MSLKRFWGGSDEQLEGEADAGDRAADFGVDQGRRLSRGGGAGVGSAEGAVGRVAALGPGQEGRRQQGAVRAVLQEGGASQGAGAASCGDGGDGERSGVVVETWTGQRQAGAAGLGGDGAGAD